MNVPGALRNGTYRVVAFKGETSGRCAWCQRMTELRQVDAQGVLGNGRALPIREVLLLCTRCHKPSIRPTVFARLIGGLATLVLTLFVAPLLVGAIYITGVFINGWVREGLFDFRFAALCLGGLALTSLATWIPLRRFVDAVKPGLVRVELPIEVVASGPDPL